MVLLGLNVVVLQGGDHAHKQHISLNSANHSSPQNATAPQCPGRWHHRQSEKNKNSPFHQLVDTYLRKKHTSSESTQRATRAYAGDTRIAGTAGDLRRPANQRVYLLSVSCVESFMNSPDFGEGRHRLGATGGLYNYEAYFCLISVGSRDSWT